jgi:hypothetical protein
MPPKKAMNAVKVTQWKVNRAKKQKADSQKKQDAIASALRNEWMKISLETKTMYGYRVRNADVCFYYGKKPCTKTPDTLKMIARALLAAGVIESGADQVTVNGIDYADTQHMYMRKHEAGKRSSRRRGPNQEQVKTLEKILARVSGRK